MLFSTSIRSGTLTTLTTYQAGYSYNSYQVGYSVQLLPGGVLLQLLLGGVLLQLLPGGVLLQLLPGGVHVCALKRVQLGRSGGMPPSGNVLILCLWNDISRILTALLSKI